MSERRQLDTEIKAARGNRRLVVGKHLLRLCLLSSMARGTEIKGFSRDFVPKFLPLLSLSWEVGGDGAKNTSGRLERQTSQSLGSQRKPQEHLV